MYIAGFNLFASASTSKIPKHIIVGVNKIALPHLLGTANFGIAICPPFSNISVAVLSKFSTCYEQVKAFVPHSVGGVFAGRFKGHH
jgi:hypothetical protein